MFVFFLVGNYARDIVCILWIYFWMCGKNIKKREKKNNTNKSVSIIIKRKIYMKTTNGRSGLVGVVSIFFVVME